MLPPLSFGGGGGDLPDDLGGGGGGEESGLSGGGGEELESSGGGGDEKDDEGGGGEEEDGEGGGGELPGGGGGGGVGDDEDEGGGEGFDGELPPLGGGEGAIVRGASTTHKQIGEAETPPLPRVKECFSSSSSRAATKEDNPEERREDQTEQINRLQNERIETQIRHGRQPVELSCMHGFCAPLVSIFRGLGVGGTVLLSKRRGDRMCDL